jgi:hypothetical protein
MRTITLFIQWPNLPARFHTVSVTWTNLLHLFRLFCHFCMQHVISKAQGVELRQTGLNDALDLFCGWNAVPEVFNRYRSGPMPMLAWIRSACAAPIRKRLFRRVKNLWKIQWLSPHSSIPSWKSVPSAQRFHEKAFICIHYILWSAETRSVTCGWVDLPLDHRLLSR